MANYHCVAVFWDYENCRPPSSSGTRVPLKIRSLAQQFGGVTTFNAYFAITADCLTDKAEALYSSYQTLGISLIHCPHNGKKDVADKMMLVDMMAYAIDNPAPATVIVISGDRDFTYGISILRLRGYHVVSIAPCSALSLKGCANEDYTWEVLIESTTEMSNRLLTTNSSTNQTINLTENTSTVGQQAQSANAVSITTSIDDTLQIQLQRNMSPTSSSSACSQEGLLELSSLQMHDNDLSDITKNLSTGLTDSSDDMSMLSEQKAPTAMMQAFSIEDISEDLPRAHSVADTHCNAGPHAEADPREECPDDGSSAVSQDPRARNIDEETADSDSVSSESYYSAAEDDEELSCDEDCGVDMQIDSASEHQHGQVNDDLNNQRSTGVEAVHYVDNLFTSSTDEVRDNIGQPESESQNVAEESGATLSSQSEAVCAPAKSSSASASAPPSYVTEPDPNIRAVKHSTVDLKSQELYPVLLDGSPSGKEIPKIFHPLVYAFKDAGMIGGAASDDGRLATSQLGSWVMRRDPDAYAAAGAKSLKQYVSLASDAKYVVADIKADGTGWVKLAADVQVLSKRPIVVPAAFNDLVEYLRQRTNEGCFKNSWSSLAIALNKRKAEPYKQAGASKLKKFLQLAEEAKLVKMDISAQSVELDEALV